MCTLELAPNDNVQSVSLRKYQRSVHLQSNTPFLMPLFINCDVKTADFHTETVKVCVLVTAQFINPCAQQSVSHAALLTALSTEHSLGGSRGVCTGVWFTSSLAVSHHWNRVEHRTRKQTHVRLFAVALPFVSLNPLCFHHSQVCGKVMLRRDSVCQVYSVPRCWSCVALCTIMQSTQGLLD